MRHRQAMRWVVTVTSLIGALCLMSCGGGVGSVDDASLAQGPFDSRGNYVEAWADKRPRSADRKKKAAMERAKKAKEQKAKQLIASKKKEKVVDRRLVSNDIRKPKPVIERRTVKRTVVTERVVSKPKPKPRISPKPKPRPVVKSKPRPKPKAKPKPRPKPKAKPKPKPLKLHAVKRGDTLYSISRKYGVSVSSIQKANGLRGNRIVTGKSLKIPTQ